MTQTNKRKNHPAPFQGQRKMISPCLNAGVCRGFPRIRKARTYKHKKYSEANSLSTALYEKLT
tara:strand:- start:18592 stop:18780 length:189 start_codon:yes stop_codon:yes gene_type:complete